MATRLIGTDSTDPWLPDVVRVKADKTQVVDVAGNFTASDVEGVLAELVDLVDTIVVTGGSMPAASTAETIAGTSTTKAVTPAGYGEAQPFFDVRRFGAVGDGATDDTAAIQAAIDAAVAVCGTVMIPAGDYVFTTLSIGGPVTIRGTGAKSTVQPLFGDARFATDPDGSVLRSTATTGKALYTAASYRGITLADLAVIGPGSGTSIGLALGHPDNGICCIRTRLQRVIVGNFAVGIYLGLENSQTDNIYVVGCLTGIQTGNAHNGNLHNATNIEKCTDYALRLQNLTDTNLFAGGVIQGNCPGGGTVVAIDNAAANTFQGIYFENAGATNTIHIGHTSGLGDYNSIIGCHFGSATADKIQIDTKQNQIIGGYVGGAAIKLAAAATRNVIIGTFPSGITDADATKGNMIFNLWSTAGTVQLGGSSDVRLAISGKKLFFETTGANSYLWRNSSGAHTELNGPGAGSQCRLTVAGSPIVSCDTAKLGFYGATPVVKAASPGTATGSDAAVINAVVTALRNLGLVT